MGDSIAVGQLARRRFWINRVTRWVVGLGGGAVIGAIALIFAYLLWVVGPIFVPGSVSEGISFNVVEREPVLVDVSENGELFVRLSSNGRAEFYEASSGTPTAAFDLGMTIVRAQRVYPLVDTYALVNEAQEMFLVRVQYIVEFDDGTRTLSPKIDFPYGNAPLLLESGAPGLAGLDVALHEGDLVVASASSDRLTLQRFRNVEEGYPLPTPRSVNIGLIASNDTLILGPRNQWLYAMDAQGGVEVLAISALDRVQRLYQGSLVAPGEQMQAVAGVLGRYSVIAASDSGYLTQWGIINNPEGYRLEVLREFKLDEPVQEIILEPRRKGFATLSERGTFTLLYPTSARIIDELQTGLTPGNPMAISPRSNLLVSAPTSGLVSTLKLDNKHPEISFGTLWAEVWYEGYEEPIYSWQSSSADNDFEPKFSLTPLAFGTLKAAFYALLFAVPIAIMGAVYTAYFMAPAMRAWVKPGIEIMAALPTVILGFIGGLWLAPIIEANLSSVLSIFVVLPVGLFLFALAWTQLPERISKPFNGWYGLIVTPLIVLTVAIAFASGPSMENLFFGGDSREWFREVMGLSYDQRNALVVGIIMGLAVIPTIFSIAEDAIYGVPNHLINGSLALGATSWQTLVRVVLLTASPGYLFGGYDRYGTRGRRNHDRADGYW